MSAPNALVSPGAVVPVGASGVERQRHVAAVAGRALAVPSSDTGAPSAKTDGLFAVGVIAIIGVMILPLPSFALDLLLTISVTLSLVVFLFSLQVIRPLEFSAFPSVLLIVTLLRLSLNVASTRLILLHGHEGPGAAGRVIQAFGQFVVGGNAVVGVVVFLILIVINFVVITKGAGRIAEVAARFTLDAMPGKQMAIDADLAAGLINEQEARQRRRQVEQEADFYGSMDGASKFVRGDAIAGLVITVVNILGGLAVGVLQRGLPVADAASTFTLLTVGDGLVSQIPALLTSVAAGLVTTRSSAGGGLAETVRRQVFGSSHVLRLAAGILAVLGLVPGMPNLAFLATAGVLFLFGTRHKTAVQVQPLSAPSPWDPQKDRAELESALPVEPVELQVGYELVPLIERNLDGNLLQRINGLRTQMAGEIGLVMPPLQIRDNLRLRPNEYRIRLFGTEVARGELQVQRLLAMSPNGEQIRLPGDSVTEPTFGLPAKWILPSDRERAEMVGLPVVDPSTVVITHLGEVLLAHAPEILGRRELQELIEIHGRVHGKLIEEIVPALLSWGQVLRVLRNLLRERVSIRDFRNVLEALADHAGDTKDPDQLTELVRQRLAKQLTAKAQAGGDVVHALVLAPAAENAFRRMQGIGASQAVDPNELQLLLQHFQQATTAAAGSEHVPVILVPADLRRSIAIFVARHLSGLSVLSFRELDPRATVKTVGVIGAAFDAVAGKAA